jgi:hypothetical protein
VGQGSDLIYVKDLRIFGNVKMEDMIIIDNSVLSFAFQLENGIPILPYYKKADDELRFLSNYLNSIYNVKDLRIENNRSIKMPYFLKSVKNKIEGKFEENDINNEYYEFEENLECTNNISNNINNGNLFKINLFSAEKNNDSVNESSYLESDSESSNVKASQFDCKGISAESSNTDVSASFIKENLNKKHSRKVIYNELRNTFTKYSQKSSQKSLFGKKNSG